MKIKLENKLCKLWKAQKFINAVSGLNWDHAGAERKWSRRGIERQGWSASSRASTSSDRRGGRPLEE